MYKNLQSKMAREGVTQRSIADYLGIHENSVGNKVLGKSPFTIEEAFKIKEKFFPDSDLLYLFKRFSTDTNKTA